MDITDPNKPLSRFFPKRKIVIDFTKEFRLRTDREDREWPDTANFFWQVPEGGFIKLISVNLKYQTALGLANRTIEVRIMRGDTVLAYIGKSTSIGNLTINFISISHLGHIVDMIVAGTFRQFGLPENMYLKPGDRVVYKVLQGAAADVPIFIDAYYQLWEYN